MLSPKTLNIHRKPLDVDEELELDDEGFCLLAALFDAPSAFLPAFSVLLVPSACVMC